MSFDLAVWYPEKRISDEEARELYVRLCDSDTSGVVAHPAVDAFYAELTAKHPEIDTIPEERIDDHDYCPWSCRLERSPSHVITCCVWPKATYVGQLVESLARKHGLAVYDPQSDRVTYPDGSTGRSAKTRISRGARLTLGSNSRTVSPADQESDSYDGITVETEMFEHREVKPHFLNPCCFGEDFAAWLKKQIAALEGSGFRFSEIIQEDYGWGFRASHGKDPFWVALSYLGDGPQEPPAQWVISVSYDPGLNLLKRLLHKPKHQALQQLRDQVRQAVASNAAIKIVSLPQYGQ